MLLTTHRALAQSLKVSPADIDWVICNSGADIWHAHPQPDGKSIDWKADEQWERHIDWRCDLEDAGVPQSWCLLASVPTET
jgi:hypothetical protein